jgi:hypothetical protein
LHHGALMAIVSGRKTQQDGTAPCPGWTVNWGFGDPGPARPPAISYRTWSFLDDCFLNALPSCPGFDPDACHSPVKQGDIGRVLIQAALLAGSKAGKRKYG